MDWQSNQEKQEAFRFYFSPNNPPHPIFKTTDETVCHNSRVYGQRDNARYPRYNLKTDSFHVWSDQDPLFFDNNGNGHRDVEEIILARAQMPAPTNLTLFEPLVIPGLEHLYARAGNYKQLPVGFVMSYWIDPASFRSFCLDTQHYDSANPLFRAIGEVIGRKTEGLYVGERIHSEERDYILLSEGEIKKVWFYFENGSPATPTEENVSSRTVYFHYPLDKKDPHIKKPGQRIYVVKSVRELPFNLPGFSSYPSHDRKIGCIPRILEEK